MDGKKRKISELEAISAQENFWDEPQKAQDVLRRLNDLQDEVGKISQLQEQSGYVLEMLDLAEEEQDEALIQQLTQEAKEIRHEFQEYEMSILFTGKHDADNAILTFHPGAGGTESQDWGSILLRMYTRWAEKSGLKVEIVDYQPGDEAGIKSVTLFIRGHYAYGKLHGEAGVHRLVRISPFDAAARRHTSFVSLAVFPEITNDVEVVINPDELRIDTYRSSGAGGQHINKTDSAVRITHIPTGIVVSCQNERSQHSNKATAMKILMSKLYEVEEQKRQEEMAKITGEHKEIAWGSQIRSYTLNPFSLIKDHRTGMESGNVQAVLDGQLDDFIYAYLQWKHEQSHQPKTL